MINKAYSAVLALIIVVSLSGCVNNDLALRTKGQNTLVKSFINLIIGDPIAVTGKIPFLISTGDPNADSTVLTDALINDLNTNGKVTGVKLGKVGKFVILINTNTNKKVKVSESFSLTTSLDSVNNDNGEISGQLNVTVNGMTAMANKKLIRAEQKDGQGANKGFKKLGKSSFIVLKTNLSDSTITAIQAGDAVNQDLVSQVKSTNIGEKVITKDLFVPFNR